MKFSLSSTFVRPLAAINKVGRADYQWKHHRWMCRQKQQKTYWIKTSVKLGLFEIQQVFKSTANVYNTRPHWKHQPVSTHFILYGADSDSCIDCELNIVKQRRRTAGQAGSQKQLLFNNNNNNEGHLVPLTCNSPKHLVLTIKFNVAPNKLYTIIHKYMIQTFETDTTSSAFQKKKGNHVCFQIVLGKISLPSNLLNNFYSNNYAEN